MVYIKLIICPPYTYTYELRHRDIIQPPTHKIKKCVALNLDITESHQKFEFSSGFLWIENAIRKRLLGLIPLKKVENK